MKINVIIPAYNEAETIGYCLRQFCRKEGVEVVVVDGGSSDGMRQVVEDSGVARWVLSPQKGRAFQMNYGAQVTRGEILLFLHADTFLPESGLGLIREVMRQPQVVGGRFPLKLSEGTPVFRLISFLSTLRSQYLGITYGDQGIFARRSVFEAVRGFPDLQIFEDSEFCSALSRKGRFVMLDEPVCSSTRRWKRGGVFRTVLWMWVLRLLFTCSVSDVRLNRWYRDVR
ncbi:MAG: TIGR04283 family arsenosugar biosynthesis glycosyltransferase [bacterium]|nr:TIGR04283 family arsenosugar biosynthesis glycosyltransferase [bacterium]